MLNAVFKWFRRLLKGSKARTGTLVIQPLPGIGDMVWHLPHLHALAAVYGPLTLLCKDRAKANDLLLWDESVQQLLKLERNPGRHDGILGFWRLVKDIRQHNFLRTWILHHSRRYDWAVFLAGVPQTFGCSDVTVGMPNIAKLHPINKANQLLSNAGIIITETEPQLRVSHSACANILERYHDFPRPWIALGVGSSEIIKQWPVDYFAQLAQQLDNTCQATLFVLAGQTEQAVTAAINAKRLRHNPHVLLPPTYIPLAEVLPLLACCDLYIGNDTGTLNMAAALQTPGIGLFGASKVLTHSAYIHPIVPVTGSGMKAITVTQVHTLAASILAELNLNKPKHASIA